MLLHIIDIYFCLFNIWHNYCYNPSKHLLMNLRKFHWDINFPEHNPRYGDIHFRYLNNSGSLLNYYNQHIYLHNLDKLYSNLRSRLLDKLSNKFHQVNITLQYIKCNR